MTNDLRVEVGWGKKLKVERMGEKKRYDYIYKKKGVFLTASSR